MVRNSGELELVAGLSVNVEGFPTPATAIGLVAGGQVSLTAAGIVEPPNKASIKVDLDPEAIQQIASALADETEARTKRRERMAQLRETFKEKV